MNTKLFFIGLIILTILIGGCVNNLQNTKYCKIDEDCLVGITKDPDRGRWDAPGCYNRENGVVATEVLPFSCECINHVCTEIIPTKVSETKATCSITSECKLPAEYMIRSDCRYDVECINTKCIVVCPDW